MVMMIRTATVTIPTDMVLTQMDTAIMEMVTVVVVTTMVTAMAATLGTVAVVEVVLGTVTMEITV